ncbi:amino acid permease-associated [Streptomyces albus]|uniref:Amino acid permease-associated n=1 Tax=Streptomyces albus (strain ATCC 21838 / DSM 41398 / FERM P-419 / JCM 4703 / NBRC 107858) TaxID=1081613 RepID=A0A0B5ESC3_STRA4|nr:amino acid permease-associated [Streptomyces albus]AOU78883.1 amino acid permease-associated [Streptomyces albus]AYN34618.1 APC family permease [Streptomyces albus]
MSQVEDRSGGREGGRTRKQAAEAEVAAGDREAAAGDGQAAARETAAGTGNVRSKGLGADSVGLVGSTVIGLSTVAPVYCLTSTLGPTVGEVGPQLPAVFLAGFLPMLLVAFAYRELNSAVPDCGTSFTWTVKAFGPRVGWMCGWGLVIATVIVLSNLAGVAAEFLYLLLTEVTGSTAVADFGARTPVHVLTVLLLIAAATALSYRGMTATAWFQYALVGLQLAVLALFVGRALGRAGEGGGRSGAGLDFSWSWFDPFAVSSFAAFTAGLSLSIFIYWGWDATLTLNEETSGSTRTPGRAAMLAMAILVGSYALTAVAAMRFAGTGETGLGLGNPATSDNVFAALAEPVLGPYSALLFLAVLASAAASLQTTFLPAARTMLAMSTYRAIPASFARVHPGFRTPGRATVAAGLATGLFYAVMAFVSENILVDTVYALGLMICFYYALTAFACVWYFRRELTGALRRDGTPGGVRRLLQRGVLPLLGGLLLTAVFAKTLLDMWDPAYGSGSAVEGVGSVFVIGVGVLLLGAVLMELMRRRSPAFFRGEVLTRETPAMVVEE